MRQPTFNTKKQNSSVVRNIMMPKFDDGLDENINTNEKSAIDYALDLLTTNEGFRSKPYLDTVANKMTAGYGFTDKADLHNWTEPQARKRLTDMANRYHTLLMNGRIADLYKTLNPKQQAALIDLLHQGGVGVLNRMPKFTKYIQDGDFAKAYDEFTFGAKNSRGTKIRDDRRRSYFNSIPVDESVLQDVVQKSQTLQPDVLSTQKPYVNINPNGDVSRAAAFDARIQSLDFINNLSNFWENQKFMPAPILPSIEDVLFKQLTIDKIPWTVR